MRDDLWKVLIGIGLCLLCSLNCGEVSQQPVERQKLGSDAAGALGGGGDAAVTADGGPGGAPAAAGGAGGAAAAAADGSSGEPCGPGWHGIIQGTMVVCVPNDGTGGSTGTGNTSGAH